MLTLDLRNRIVLSRKSAKATYIEEPKTSVAPMILSGRIWTKLPWADRPAKLSNCKWRPLVTEVSKNLMVILPELQSSCVEMELTSRGDNCHLSLYAFYILVKHFVTCSGKGAISDKLYLLTYLHCSTPPIWASWQSVQIEASPKWKAPNGLSDCEKRDVLVW